MMAELDLASSITMLFKALGQELDVITWRAGEFRRGAWDPKLVGK